MTARSQERGWPIEYDGAVWRYSDTQEVAAGERACRRCGLLPIDGKDACLIAHHNDRTIRAACCGHGIEKGEIMAEIIKNITIGVSAEYVNVLMLAAKSEAIKARVAGMQAANYGRERNGELTVYDDPHFASCERELVDIARQLDETLEDIQNRAESERKAEEADPIDGPLAMTKDGVYPEEALEAGQGADKG